MSVELYRTQEDLAREKHANELKIKSMVTEFDHTLSKRENESDVNKDKADSAEKELIRVRELFDTIIEQGRKGEVPRLKSMLRIQGHGKYSGYSAHGRTLIYSDAFAGEG